MTLADKAFDEQVTVEILKSFDGLPIGEKVELFFDGSYMLDLGGGTREVPPHVAKNLEVYLKEV